MAADNGLLLGWNRVARGKEDKVMALFGESLAFWGQLQQAGVIDSFEPVLLLPHGGDLNGFILVRGDADKLDQVMASDAYLAIDTKANYYLEGYGAIRAFFGEEITRRFGAYQKTITEG